MSLQMQAPAEMRADEPAPDAEPGEAEPAGAGQLVFAAHELAFEGVPDTVPAGEYTVVLDNEGNLPHDVAFEELGGTPLVGANAGAQDSATVSREPGTHTYHCTIPGHRPGGMEGTLTVTD